MTHMSPSDAVAAATAAAALFARIGLRIIVPAPAAIV